MLHELPVVRLDFGVLSWLGGGQDTSIREFSGSGHVGVNAKHEDWRATGLACRGWSPSRDASEVSGHGEVKAKLLP